MLSGLSCGWSQDPCLRFYDNAPEGGRVAEILTQGQSIGISPRSIESYPDSVNLVSTPSSSDQQYKDGDLLDSTRDQLGMMYISTMAQNTPSNKATNLQVAPSKLSLISLPNDLGSDEELTPGIVTSGKIGNNNNHHQQIGLQDENILVQSDFVRMINNNANNNSNNNNNNSVVSNQTLNRSMGDTFASQGALQDIQFLHFDNPAHNVSANNNNNNNNSLYNNNHHHHSGNSGGGRHTPSHKHHQGRSRNTQHRLDFQGDYNNTNNSNSSNNNSRKHFHNPPPTLMIENPRGSIQGIQESLLPSMSPLCSPTNSYQQGACGWGQSSLYPLMGLTYPHCGQVLYSPGINHQMGVAMESQSSLPSAANIPQLSQNGICNMQTGNVMGQMYPFAFNHMEYQKVMQQLTCPSNNTTPSNHKQTHNNNNGSAQHSGGHRHKEVWRSRRDGQQHKHHTFGRHIVSRREHRRGDRPSSRQGSYFSEDANWVGNFYYNLNSMSGHLVELAMDQDGSRLIQMKLQEADEEQLSHAFQEMVPSLLTLMTNVFGNYVVQKLLDFCSPAHKKLVAERLQNHMLFLSLHMYGCRVVQKIIETLDQHTVNNLIRQLEGNVMKCVKDQNGNHVIQKCLECLQTSELMFMYKTFVSPVDNLIDMCSDAYGGRVVQRLLENCTDQQIQNVTKQEILKRTVELSKDQYGNYIVQHLVEHGAPADRETIVSMLCPDIVKLSLQKFASNVIEKCLAHGSIKDKRQMIEKMLGNGKDCQAMLLLARDAYGNYVVQKMLEVCDDSSRHLMVNYIDQHQDCLRKYSYGKHIVGKVMRTQQQQQQQQQCSYR